ncbi:MAG: transposase [Rubrivivax sp.]
MARLPRLSLPGHVHHVVQRGHNRQDIVVDDVDRARWKAFLTDAAVTHRVDVHAWLLLRDHFHVVVTPSQPQALGRMMQALGRRHAAEFNRRHGRTGTLWEGRFRSSLVQPGAWVLECMLFVESHEARLQGAAAQALQEPWSSVGHHLGRGRDPLIVEPAAWWGLGNTPFEREAAWRERLEHLPSQAVVDRITAASRRGWPIADQAFLSQLAPLMGRPVVPRPRGRPGRTLAPGT